jgi:hypothetical protein
MTPPSGNLGTLLVVTVLKPEELRRRVYQVVKSVK